VAKVVPVAANVLCIWHVNQNVLALAKAALRDTERAATFMRLCFAA